MLLMKMLTSDDDKIMLLLNASSVSITELSTDVLSLGSYGYLGLPIFRSGPDAGRYAALAHALQLTGYFENPTHCGRLC